MNTQSLINHLENNLRIEIEAKRRALLQIEAQEKAIAANDPSAFQKAVEEARSSCVADERNAKRRTQLLTDLATHWQLPVGVMTLGGVARRMGDSGRGLELLRAELRNVLAEVVKRNRRLSALIGMHRRINADIMRLILGCDSHADVNSGGFLVNAEA